MDDLKLVVASNLIKLRTEAGMTQVELGEKLSYSDKTISKWERAEALPDVTVLKKISEIFHVTMDEITSAHDEWQPPKEEEEVPERSYSAGMIAWVAVMGIWTLALLIFVIFWVLGHLYWVVFAAAIPATLITLLVLNSIWNHGRFNLLLVAALVPAIVAVIYLVLLKYNPWQLFLVLIPAEVMVYSSFKIKKKKPKK